MVNILLVLAILSQDVIDNNIAKRFEAEFIDKQYECKRKYNNKKNTKKYKKLCNSKIGYVYY